LIRRRAPDELVISGRESFVVRTAKSLAGEVVINKGVNMKSELIVVAGTVLLFAVSGVAHSQVTQPTWSTDQPSAQQPAVPAMTGAQMTDPSVGGVPMSGTHASGTSRYAASCVVGLSCDIYKGN
jgi:hypothetical protein